MHTGIQESKIYSTKKNCICVRFPLEKDRTHQNERVRTVIWRLREMGSVQMKMGCCSKQENWNRACETNNSHFIQRPQFRDYIYILHALKESPSEHKNTNVTLCFFLFFFLNWL